MRTPTSPTSASASSGPKIAPRLSMARSKPCRPYADAGTHPRGAHFATARAGRGSPRARSQQTGLPRGGRRPDQRRQHRRDRGRPPRVARRRRGRRRGRHRRAWRRPGEAVGDSSMSPSALAGAPSVEVRNVGSSEVGTSCPASESRLAAPIPLTPLVSQPVVDRPSSLVLVVRALEARYGPTHPLALLALGADREDDVDDRGHAQDDQQHTPPTAHMEPVSRAAIATQIRMVASASQQQAKSRRVHRDRWSFCSVPIWTPSSNRGAAASAEGREMPR